MTMLVVLLLVINKINHKERKDEGNMECSDEERERERERETVLLKSRCTYSSIYYKRTHNFFILLRSMVVSGINVQETILNKKNSR